MGMQSQGPRKASAGLAIARCRRHRGRFFFFSSWLSASDTLFFSAAKRWLLYARSTAQGEILLLKLINGFSKSYRWNFSFFERFSSEPVPPGYSQGRRASCSRPAALQKG